MSLDVEKLPEALGAEAALAWDNILERAGDEVGARLRHTAGDKAIAAQLPRVMACSPFVADLSRRKPGLLLDMLASGEIQRSQEEGECRAALKQALAEDGA